MVGIVIPAYNCNDTIRDSLNSLLAQTKKTFAVFVIDDCSTDNNGSELKEIVQSYSEKLLIGYRRLMKNSGAGVARQTGVEWSKKFPNIDYIMFLDADDILYPRAVEVLYREAKTHDLDFLSSTIKVEKKGEPGYDIPTKSTLTWLHGKVYRKQFLFENNIHFFDNVKVNEDSCFNMMVYNLANNKKYIEETTYLWRDNKESITRKNKETYHIDYGEYFIIGQAQAMQKVISSKENCSDLDLISNLAVIYNYYQANLACCGVTCDTITVIHDLLNDPNIFKIFQNKKWKVLLTEKLRASEVRNDTIILYVDTFQNWVHNLNPNLLKEYF